MQLSNLYKNTKARVATGLVTLTLAGTLAVATPAYGKEVIETNQEYIAPVQTHAYQGPKDFKDRYGEEAFKELKNIQQKYANAIEAESTPLELAAQMKIVNYVGLENIMKAQLFVSEVEQEFNIYLTQNAPTIQNIAQDVEDAINGNTSGLEANLEKYMPVIEDAINLAKENAVEYYQENQEFVDRIVTDAKATLNDSELIAASEEFQQNIKETLTTQVMEFYGRNEQVFQQIIGDAQETITDPEFIGKLQSHQNTMNKVLINGIMGEEFAAQIDTMEVRIERLTTQKDQEIENLIEKLEIQRASEKGF
jgi:hypothetical protein